MILKYIYVPAHRYRADPEDLATFRAGCRIQADALAGERVRLPGQHIK